MLLLLSACRNDNVDSVALARAALANQDVPTALVLLKVALQEHPDAAEARFLLGQLLLDRGDAAAAVIELEKARERGHAESLVVPPLARALLAKGEYRPLLHLAQSAGPLNDGQAQADLETSVAKAHFALKETDAGRQALARALQQAPDHVPARLLQARRQVLAGDLQGARDIVAATVQRLPQDTKARLMHADLLASAGSGAAAVAEYRKVIELGGDLLQAHGGALTVLIAQKDYTGAAVQLEALRKVRPKHPQTTYFDALLLLHQRDLPAAAARAEQLLADAPQEPLYQRLAGTVALESGEARKAAAHLATALQATPGDPVLRRLVGLAQVRSGQGRLALATLQPLLATDKGDAEALTPAGVADLQTGNAPRAQARFAAAARLQPRAAHLRTALALSRLGSGKDPAALAELQQIAATDSGVMADSALVQALIQRREYEPALRAIERMERKDPKAPTAAMLRGEVHLRRADLSAARTSYEKALALAPEHFAATAALTELDLRQDRPDQARQRFEALVRANPRHVSALVALASLAEMTGAPPADASRLLREAVRADPQQAGPRLLLVQHELKHHQGQAAMTAADEAVQALPNDLRFQALLGSACVAAGDLGRAAQVFGKLAVLQPGSAEPLVNLARVHMAARDVSAARTALQRALKAQPDAPTALQDLARLETQQRHPAEARALARRLQALQPTRAMGHVIDAEVAASLKEWKEAEAAYTLALSKEGDRSAVAKALHALHLATGRPEKAASLAERWAREQPRDVAFLQYLGDEAMLRQDLPQAMARYQAVLRVQPHHAAVLNNLAWATHKLGRPGALALAERASELRPGEAAYLDTLAQLLGHDRQFERALATQLRALTLLPDDPVLRLGLARLYAQAGDKLSARAELDRIAALGPRFSGQAEVLALRQKL